MDDKEYQMRVEKLEEEERKNEIERLVLKMEHEERVQKKFEESEILIKRLAHKGARCSDDISLGDFRYFEYKFSSSVDINYHTEKKLVGTGAILFSKGKAHDFRYYLEEAPEEKGSWEYQKDENDLKSIHLQEIKKAVSILKKLRLCLFDRELGEIEKKIGQVLTDCCEKGDYEPIIETYNELITPQILERVEEIYKVQEKGFRYYKDAKAVITWTDVSPLASKYAKEREQLKSLIKKCQEESFNFSYMIEPFEKIMPEKKIDKIIKHEKVVNKLKRREKFFNKLIELFGDEDKNVEKKDKSKSKVEDEIEL